MACNEEESGKHKCECYWADSDQETRSYGPYTVKLLKSRRMCNDFNLRTMELIYVNSNGETSKIYFHCFPRKNLLKILLFASYENRCAVSLLGVARSWSSGFSSPVA